MFLQTLATKAVTFVGQLVLAWLLAREDFGQIALAYTVTSFVSLLVNPGIDVILVQRGRRFDLWSTPAFYFSLFTSLVGSATILAVAPLAAKFYGAPQLTGMLAVLAVGTPLGALLLVPTAKLRAAMRFKALAAINLFQTVLQTALTLGFAQAGFGVYSFVLPVPLVYAVVGALLWLAARPAVRSVNPFRRWRYLIGDSSYIFGQRFLLTVVQQSDYIILGALYGDIVVGPYFFAYMLAGQATRLTAGSLQLVLMAGLSRMPAFSAQQTEAALRATKAIALCGIPLCLIQAAVAEPLLRAFYGTKWVESILLVQFISIGMAFDVPSWPACSLLQSRGQFRFAFAWSSVAAPLFVVAVLIGAIYGGSLGAAIGLCVFFVVSSPLLAFWVFRSSGIGWRETVDTYTRPLVIGLVAAGASLSVIQLLERSGSQPALQLVAGIATGLLAMGLGARTIMSSSWHDIMLRVRNAVARSQPLGS
jgi:PST family polysaccharide transporter